MRFWIPGIRRPLPNSEATEWPAVTGRAELASVRIGPLGGDHDFGRREVDFGYRRLQVPSLLIDHTELMLRRCGVHDEEGLAVWAGTISGGDAFTSTLIFPALEGRGRYHGEVREETVAHIFNQLEELDLLPLAQIHSHPGSAYLSDIDAERPIVALPGFLSIIVPDFGFGDLSDVGAWRVYEFRAGGSWRELDLEERRRRLIVDPSLLVIK